VIVPNYPPVLSADEVTPTTGTTEDTYSYCVIFTDANDDAPSYISAHIDGDIGGHVMTVDGSAPSILKDGDHLNGEKYKYETSLASGSHDFYFRASDGLLDASTTLKVGPTVNTPSNWVPILTNPHVSPTTGSTDLLYKYAVTYSDTDNDEPSYVKVFLDGRANGQTLELDSSASSNLWDGNYINGERYSFETGLLEGNHTFKFECGDGSDKFTTPVLDGPKVFKSIRPEAVITLPGNNSEFIDDDKISFSANNSIDPVGGGLRYRWTSNISGLLSMRSFFRWDLEAGLHRITLEVIDVNLIKDEARIHLNILEREPPSMVSFVPAETNITMFESYTIFLNITAIDKGELTYRWFLDGDDLGESDEDYIYRAMAPSIGDHEISVFIENDQVQPKVSIHTWGIQVLDPRPKIIRTEPENETTIDKGASQDFTIEVKDPQDLPLTTLWYLDYVLVAEGETYSFGQKGAGTYDLLVVVENPDGYTVSHRWSVGVIGDDLSDISISDLFDMEQDRGSLIGGTPEGGNELGGQELSLLILSGIFVIIAMINLIFVGNRIRKRLKDRKNKKRETGRTKVVTPPLEVTPIVTERVPILAGPPMAREYTGPPLPGKVSPMALEVPPMQSYTTQSGSPLSRYQGQYDHQRPNTAPQYPNYAMPHSRAGQVPEY